MRMTRFASVCSLMFLTASGLIGADAPKTFQVSEFTFNRPEKWEWVETTSAMRKAQLKVPGKNKDESAEVVFFYFGEGNGGGTKANVERWLGQFQNQPSPKIEEGKIGTHKVTYVQVEGTYMSGMPGGPRTPQPNSMLNGAIIEGGNGNVFIKMTGPAALVKSATADFRKMVESAAK